ncbi:MAG: tetratricopeptide repeat protein [Candidatus Angelobacter sp.]
MSEMNPLAAEAKEHHNEGFRLLVEGSHAEAREQFLKAIDKNPNWAPPYLSLGQTFFFQKKPKLRDAVQCFRRVVELSPEWVEGHHWLGTAQEKKGELHDAVESFEQAIRLAPSDTRPLISLGVCLTRLNQFAAAISSLRRAIDLKPHYAEASAHLFLADALKGIGQIDAACKEWKLVLKMPSEYPEHDSAKKEAKQLLSRHCGSHSAERSRKR